jgi:hypothetical protein
MPKTYVYHYSGFNPLLSDKLEAVDGVIVTDEVIVSQERYRKIKAQISKDIMEDEGAPLILVSLALLHTLKEDTNV